MRRCAFLLLATCALCFAIKDVSFAQTPTPADSVTRQNSAKNALTLFYSSVGKESPLYNGTEYYQYDPRIKGNAYYNDINAFTPGSVNYDNVEYNNVPMLYDIYGDQLVALLYNHFTMYTLIKDKVSSFDFLDHHFIRIDTVTFMNNPEIKPGYYDEIYKGPTQVLIRSDKNIQNASDSFSPETYFNSEKSYFVRKNNIYYSFSSQGSLLDILKDRKKEIQKYIKANQIRYRQNPEQAMVQIASYYDQLTK